MTYLMLNLNSRNLFEKMQVKQESMSSLSVDICMSLLTNEYNF
jgi:hypothetical protein